MKSLSNLLLLLCACGLALREGACQLPVAPFDPRVEAAIAALRQLADGLPDGDPKDDLEALADQIERKLHSNRIQQTELPRGRGRCEPNESGPPRRWKSDDDDNVIVVDKDLLDRGGQGGSGPTDLGSTLLEEAHHSLQDIDGSDPRKVACGEFATDLWLVELFEDIRSSNFWEEPLRSELDRIIDRNTLQREYWLVRKVMKHPHRPWAIGSLLILGIAHSALPGQEPSPHWTSVQGVHITAAAEATAVHLEFSAGSLPTQSFILPLAFASIADLGTGRTPDELLIVGSDPATAEGVLAAASLDAIGSTASLDQERRVPGASFRDVVCHAGSSTIFVLGSTGTGRALWTTTWTATGALQPLQLALEEASGARFLTEDDWHLWRSSPDGLAGADLVRGASFFEAGSSYERLRQGGSGWVSEPEPWSPSSPVYGLLDGYHASTTGPWIVTGPPSAIELVERESGVVLLQTSIGPAGSTSVQTSQPLDAGATYVFRSQTQPADTSRAFTPLHRIGAPALLEPDGTASQRPGPALEHGQVRLWSSYVGSSRFAASSSLGRAVSLAGASEIVDVSLWISATLPGQPPALAVIGNAVVLIPADITDPKAKELRADATGKPVHQVYPIPDDAGLVGVTLWCQFVGSLADGRTALSDVFGSEVGPPPGRSSTARAGQSAADTAEAVQRWFAPLRTRSDERRIRELLRRVRR